MRHNQKLGMIILMFFLPLLGEEVMKITLNGTVSDEVMSSLSTIIFEDNYMVSEGSYSLNDIKKIEFFEGVTSTIGDLNNIQITKKIIKSGEIDFVLKGSTLCLTLPEVSNISVSIFSLNGKKVAELYSGNAEKGLLSLNLNGLSLASGIYSTVVKVENALFVKKIMIN